MKAIKFTTEQEWFSYLSAQVKEMDQRERIVIKFPFGLEVTRLEIYCGETTGQIGSTFGEMVSGQTLAGPVSISVFSDYSNKPSSKSSYTYLNDCLRHIQKISKGIVEICQKEKV